MALPKLRQDEVVTPALAFLAERGVYPNGAGRYDEQAVLRTVLDVLRERGLDPDVVVDDATGEWTVEVRDQRTPAEPRIAIAFDADRTTALIRALEMALTWLSPEEERDLFDRNARAMLGMSGDDFLSAWEAGELSGDDPAVIHLLMMRPRD